MLVPILSHWGKLLIGMYNLREAGQELTLINILGNAPSLEILIGATLLAICVMLVFTLRYRLVPRRQILGSLYIGARSMVDVSLVILFATGLAAVSETLGTGAYISSTFADAVIPQILPVLIFIISMLITVATGFSWNSMAIVMPVS